VRHAPHDGHTRVLLAFYTPSVTSKSLLISLLFLERPIFVFQILSVWRSHVLHFISFAQHDFARWDNVHGFTSVFYPSETCPSHLVELKTMQASSWRWLILPKPLNRIAIPRLLLKQVGLSNTRRTFLLSVSIVKVCC